MDIKSLNLSSRLVISAFCLSVLFGVLYAVMAINVSTTGKLTAIPSLEKVQQKYGGILLVSAMKGSMYDEVSDDESIDIVKAWVEAGAPQDEYESKIATIMDEDCSSCHSASSTMTDAMTSMPLTSYEEVLATTTRGQPWSKLVVETHTHLFAIGMMMLVLGLMLANSNVKSWVKNVLILTGFAGLWGDTLFWTLAKFVGFVGYLIPFTGGLMVGSICAMAGIVLLACWVRVPFISKQ
jgi:hypothetical protein